MWIVGIIIVFVAGLVLGSGNLHDIAFSVNGSLSAIVLIAAVVFGGVVGTGMSETRRERLYRAHRRLGQQVVYDVTDYPDTTSSNNILEGPSR